MMNKRQRRQALVSLLSDKATNWAVSVLKKFESGKSTDMAKLATALHADKRGLYVVTPEESAVKKAGQNVVDVKVIEYKYLNPADLLKYEHIIFTEAAIKQLPEHFSN